MFGGGLTIVSSIPAFAATPRVVVCPSCDHGRMIKVQIGYENLGTTYVPCQHGYSNGQDSYVEEKFTYRDKCDDCSYETGAYTELHTRNICESSIY